MIWLVLAYLFHTLGELCLSPMGLSYLSKLIPARMIAFMFGVYYLAVAIGNKLAHYVGGDIENITAEYSLSGFFLIFTIVPISLGLVSLLLHPLIKKSMHGIRKINNILKNCINIFSYFCRTLLFYEINSTYNFFILDSLIFSRN